MATESNDVDVKTETKDDVKTEIKDVDVKIEVKDVAAAKSKDVEMKSEVEDEKSKVEDVKHEITDLEAKIIRQIEYYFCDNNLSRDKFMQGIVKSDGGWLPLETLVKFNRLKTLSTDYEIITNALKKSMTGLIEVSEDGQKIRRSPEHPVPDFDEAWKQQVECRTIYAKGFPMNSTLDELLEFFKGQGNVESIYMRRHFQKKSFKGSVFASFKTKEDADKFMSKDEVCYSKTPLKCEMRADYIKRKMEEKEEMLKKKQQKREQREKDAEDEKKTIQEEENHKGTVLHMDGFSRETAREDIKNAFSSFASIKWVLFQRGQTEAWVQFNGENSATTAFEKLTEKEDGNIVIREQKITCKVVDAGDDEEGVIKRINDQREEVRMRVHKPRGGSRGRGGGRGRFQRNNNRGESVKFQGKKRRFSDDEDEDVPNGKGTSQSDGAAADKEAAPAKVAKVEVEDK